MKTLSRPIRESPSGWGEQAGARLAWRVPIEIPPWGIHVTYMTTGRAIRCRRTYPAALMLLAALSLVFHGAARGFAHPVAGHSHGHVLLAHSPHEDCSGHGAGRYAGHGQEVVAISPSSPGDDGHGSSALAHALVDCCTAVAAAVVPRLGSAQLGVPPVSRGVSPQTATVPEGLMPESPGKPPRTIYQG